VVFDKGRLCQSLLHGWTTGPGALEGRMRNYLDGLEQRNGTAYLELVAITLARIHFKSLDDLARATGADSTTLLDTAETEILGDH
jgi:hypothetical protein